MSPTGMVEVNQLSFNDLICHLMAAHEREIMELRAEIKAFRCTDNDAQSSGDASSHSSAVETSAFPSRQATLPACEDYEPLPENAEACLRERSEDLPITTSSTQRGHTGRGSKRSGPDAKALACALQIAQTIGLGAISEDHAHAFEQEAALMFNESTSSRTSTDRSDPQEASTKTERSSKRLQGTSTLPQSKQTNPTLLPSCQVDDDEPLPEEDKSGSPKEATSSRSTKDRRGYKAVDTPACHRGADAGASPSCGSSAVAGSQSNASTATTDSQTNNGCTKLGREWSIFSEKTGDAAPTVKSTSSTGLGLTGLTATDDSELGLSSAIWIEASDQVRRDPLGLRRPLTPVGSRKGSSASPHISPPREEVGISGLAQSRSSLKDVALDSREDSELLHVRINDDTPCGVHQARLPDMPRENFSKTLPELEQTLDAPAPTIVL